MIFIIGYPAHRLFHQTINEMSNNSPNNFPEGKVTSTNVLFCQKIAASYFSVDQQIVSSPSVWLPRLKNV